MIDDDRAFADDEPDFRAECVVDDDRHTPQSACDRIDRNTAYICGSACGSEQLDFFEIAGM